ncbi:MAG: ABC transporter substrate-binding protein, partial [Chloroflexi bacterium]|nr:ABC transporter substrate-binding protein [Chloroflexota bacterium]
MTAKMRKLMPVLVGAMTMALVIASCGGDDDTPTSVPAGATATAAPTSTSAPTGPSGSLTTAQATIGNESYIPRMMGPTERLIANLTYDPAMGIDRDDGISLNTEFGLMSAFEVNVVGNSVDLVMHIRPNIPWHKGEGIFTTEDFKFSYGQMIREGGLFANVGNMQRFVNNDIENMEVVDETTVILHSTKEWGIADMERAVMQQGILPQAYFERVGGEDEFKLAPIGTGPWQFLEHRPGQSYKV